VEVVGLNEDEMAFIIKRFKTTLKGCKEYPNKNKTKGKCSCFKCGKTGHFIAQCPNNDNDQGQEKHGKREKKNYRKAKGEAHIGKEWDSDCSSSDSKDEGLAASAFDNSSLFPNERHTCLMAKEKKVHIRDTPKYSSSSDEESSDDEVDYSDLFKGLDRAKVEKINELIDALNEKDRLLEKKEDILYEEHDKFVSVKKSLALEIKKNEIISSELSSCHESISSLKDLNVELNAKLEKVNETSSCVEHIIISNRCKDFDIDAYDKHLTSIAKLNNEVTSLNAQLKTCKVDYDKLKFARDAYTVGRHPSIKDGLGFQKETKNLTNQRTSVLNKEKGKALWLVVLKRTMPIFMIGNSLVMLIIIDAMIVLVLMMLHLILMLCLHLVPLLFMVEIGLGEIMFLLMLLGKFIMDLLLFTMPAMLPLCFYARMQK
jgi:hypothetical protein